MMRDMKGADADALGAKTARACDSCLRRRARWFCAADDAFLCNSCDTLVHSANQLASRHERVRLQTASSKVTTARAWHSGFTRKARTPRHNKHVTLQQQRLIKEQVLFNNNSILPLVPEISGEDAEPSTHIDEDETEEQLLCRVPVFDPFDSEPCSAYNDIKNDSFHESGACDLGSIDIDLAEFAAGVESLLGSSGEVFDRVKEESEVVKVKDEELDGEIACHLDSVLDMANDDEFEWNVESVFSPEACAKEEELEKETVGVSNDSTSVGEGGTKREIFLRLNYDEVINAWTSKGSSWTTSNPSQFILDDDSWSNCLGWSGTEGGLRSLRGRLGGSGDGAREARVSRYREKRRTRLFGKKIRYEVRKLNAEKRPRMKGRFVKRTCFVGGATTPFPPNYH